MSCWARGGRLDVALRVVVAVVVVVVVASVVMEKVGADELLDGGFHGLIRLRDLTVEETVCCCGRRLRLGGIVGGGDWVGGWERCCDCGMERW